MLLEQLSLHDFRNIEMAHIRPHPYFNILSGANAQGKTNLLESLSILGNLKSFRSGHNDELIRHGQNRCSIKGKTSKNKVAHEIQVNISRDGKQALLDGKQVNQPESYLACLRLVVFSPEEVNLVKGAPAGRRRLLDRAVFQVQGSYLAEVRKYDRLLKQRNSLLKKGCAAAEIEPWTEELVRSGARIRQARSEFLLRLVPRLTECYREICGEKEQVELVYREQHVDLANLEATLMQDLNRQKEQERKYGITLSGPHRDDFEFFIDGRPLKSYASQGQQRSFILAFKAAQGLDLLTVHGEPPLLLLDDLTGELDRQRQELFYKFLLTMQSQVFITTTDVKPLLDGGIEDGYFFRVENGTFHVDSL